MAEHTRKDPRAKVLSMTVRYKSATLDEFIEHHSHDVSRGGMYIKTPQPFPPGTLLKFEVKIAADQKVMQGVGRVVWRREADDASSEHPAGMGVKFIKLDEESKGIIDQLVTARMGDISAFDEVAPETELPQSGLSEPPVAAAPNQSASSEGFFPKATNHVPQPAPEDRTVMKQATELLQEALREVGGGAGSEPSIPSATPAQDVIPKAPKVAGVTPAPAKATRTAPLAHEQTPRYQRIPTPVAASSVKPEAKAFSPSAESPKLRGGTTTSEPVISKKGESVVSPAFEASAPNAASRPITDAAPKTVPASPMATRRVAQAAPAPVADDEYKLPLKQTIPPSRGLRVGIILLLVGGAAAAVFALSRKPATPAAPEPAPMPSVSQRVESAPVVLNLTGSQPDAATVPSVAVSPSAVPSDAPAASAAPVVSAEMPVASEKPAVPVAPKADMTVKPRAVRHKKADAGALAPPPLDKADDLTPTPTPTKSGSEGSGTTDSTPAPSSKSKSKSATPAPTPTPTEESPL